MAVVETLEVRFQADMGDLSAQLTALSGRILGLGKAMEAGGANLSGSAAALVRSVAEALRESAGATAAPEAAGSALVAGFARGISNGQVSALSAAQRTAVAAKFSNAAAVSAARSAGAALGQGFANGISGKYGAVMAAANRIASAAVSRIRSALRIHSPSKVSFELGEYFGEGFAGGVRDSIQMAQESARALSTNAVSVLQSAADAGGASALSTVSAPTVEIGAPDAGGIAELTRAAVCDALGGTEIQIPLNVDGVKLGEASIRGINLVTRSAGRVLLEI